MSKNLDRLMVSLLKFLFLISMMFTLGIAKPSIIPKVDASTNSPIVEPLYQWQIECADCPKSIAGMGDRSIALDSSGNPIIAYGGDHLYLTWYDGSQWQNETVDNSPGVGSSASLALDEFGYPHISYYDSPNDFVKYAYKDASGWHYESVDSGKDGSLAIDKNNYIHIAYVVSQNPNVLKYALRDSSEWQIQFIDNGVVVGDSPSLVVATNGYPHISYREYGPNYRLEYIYQDATGWHNEIVEDGITARTPSLILDTDGEPHICFERDWDELVYDYKDASGWHSTVVDDSGSDQVGEDCSIQLDSNQEPHISYYDWTNYDLKYAYYNGSSWHIQVVDNTGDSGASSSLALDSNGYPRISYGSDGNLSYAFQDGGGWHTQVLEIGASVGWYNSLILDSSGYPHMAHTVIPSALGYTYRDNTGWHTEIIDHEYDGGFEWTSIAIDTNDYPHIAYFDYYYWGSRIKYAYKDNTGWHIEIVSSGLGDYSGYVSLALDNNNFPHISFSEDLSGTLQYSYKDGTGWHTSIIDSGLGDWNIYTSLRLDSTQYPHIGYSDYLNGHLKYAYQDSGGWHIEIVDNSGIEINTSSLDLDQSGYPHISYSNGDLKYAYKDMGGWDIVTVDNSESYVSSTSMELDGNGNPFISYVENYPDSNDSDLKLGYKTNLVWHIETVDGEGFTSSYGYTSLELHNNGLPIISYQDFFSYDLIIAAGANPILNVNHANGSPGSFFSFSGSGYPANSIVKIQVNGIEVGTVLTDSFGNLSFILDTSQVTEGNYIVTASVNPSASAAFMLDNNAPFRPKEGTDEVFVLPPGVSFIKSIYLPIIRR